MAIAKTRKTTTRNYPDNVTPLNLTPAPVIPTDEQRKAQTALVDAQLAEQPAQPEPTDELARLRAEQKRLAAELKAAREKKAEQRKAERAEREAYRLEQVAARQANSPRKSLAKGLGAALRMRLQAGQSRDEATAAILEQCRALLDAASDPTPRAKKADSAE